MAIRCPYCKRDFDVTLFEFDKTVTCHCGNTVRLQHFQPVSNQSARFTDQALKDFSEEKKISEIQHFADRISFLIVSSDYPQFDIEIDKEKLREKIISYFPGKAYLYELIYAPRFRRLESQFREQ